MPAVAIATMEDIPPWIGLARKVEYLFGPMCEDPKFLHALHKNIDRRSALCVREAEGPPGSPLQGAMLFSPKPPEYSIGWLAVAGTARRQGVARQMMEHLLGLVVPPAEIVVTTFGADTPDGQPARRFYERFGFRPAESVPNGQDGGSRQVFRRHLFQVDAKKNGF